LTQLDLCFLPSVFDDVGENVVDFFSNRSINQRERERERERERDASLGSNGKTDETNQARERALSNIPPVPRPDEAIDKYFGEKAVGGGVASNGQQKWI
jgi:hypothetical protein